MLFTPFLRVNTPEICYILYLNPGKITEGINSLIYIPFSLDMLILLISLITIFLFKKRPLQMKLCTLIALLSFGLTALMVSVNYVSLPPDTTISITYTFAVGFPMVNIILAFIAKRLIKSDEELVKSADRIR